VEAEFFLVETISDRGRINAFVDDLNRYQQDWSATYVTAPAGELRVTCWADDEKWFTVVVCPGDTDCEIGTDIGGRSCYRKLSRQEINALLALLGLDPEILTEAENRNNSNRTR
jgi:hypothetical protein